jgi:Cu+-exporting ATPase
VWLLENLFCFHDGIGKSLVNFPRREVSIAFDRAKISLSELAALLASIGYEPVLTLGELDKQKPDSARKREWLQVGVAGFAFGNTMLLSLPAYLGLDSLSAPVLKSLFGCLSMALAVPVLAYSASDYWRSARLALRQRVLTLEVPIVLGLAAIYAQSAWEILSGRGTGYLDSLTGLVFLLLCGRIFQKKTHDRLAFDRDYKSFFPLSVVRKTNVGEETVAISHLRIGDRLLLRNGELIPADGRLVHGAACIDYSFVTGESEPVARTAGDYLYAGGRQIGPAIELETVKPVSQSYLTSLWNHEAFQKNRDDDLNTLTNRYSRRFTRIVIGVAVGAGLFWLASGEGPRGLKAFTSVLIVACPCALALAAPFALGTVQRLSARAGVFVKNARVIERLAQVQTIVFDKTGTLTEPSIQRVGFHGRSEVRGAKCEVEQRWQSVDGLSVAEAGWVYSLARHSTHPHAGRIAFSLGEQDAQPVRSFVETPGRGIEGNVHGHEIWLGAQEWLGRRGLVLPELGLPAGSSVHLAIDGQCRGAFVLANSLRPEIGKLLSQLAACYELALLSGDNERERELFRDVFGSNAQLLFNQSPLDKLSFIRQLQASAQTVMMVGDGLNDAGALKQSDVGVAVVERAGTFSPASDVILEAAQIGRLPAILDLACTATRIVKVGFGISALYNLAGISIAAAGLLSPWICAVLMPLSSVSVVLFACGLTSWKARRGGLM